MPPPGLPGQDLALGPPPPEPSRRRRPCLGLSSPPTGWAASCLPPRWLCMRDTELPHDHPEAAALAGSSAPFPDTSEAPDPPPSVWTPQLLRTPPSPIPGLPGLDRGCSSVAHFHPIWPVSTAHPQMSLPEAQGQGRHSPSGSSGTALSSALSAPGLARGLLPCAAFRPHTASPSPRLPSPWSRSLAPAPPFLT